MMSLPDRIQATIRLPAYQEDFQRLVHYLQEEKFGDPEEPAPRGLIRHVIETYPTLPEIVQVAERWRLPTAIDPEHRNTAAKLQPWLDEANRPSRKTAKPIQVKERRPARYLELKVDLSERTDILCEIFHEYVKAHKRTLPAELVKATRGKNPELDQWEIYDLVEVKGKTKYKILRNKLKEAGKSSQVVSPSESTESKLLYKQIGSAYQKAKNCIKSVMPPTL